VSLATHYNEALRNIPPPGAGCHPALLGVANLGVLANIPGHQVHADIRAAIPPGRRRVPDREIRDTITKAFSENTKDSTYRAPTSTRAPAIKDGKGTLQKIMSKAEIKDEMELMELSPIRLLDPVALDQINFLSIMFRPVEFVFIGERHEPGIMGQTIRRRWQWVRHLAAGGKAGPLLCINPLTGESAPKKSGDGETLRGDACIAAYRHVLVEFDNLTHEEQIRFFTSVKLPIKALVDSGNKSIHCWIDLQKLAKVATSVDWDAHIKDRLFGRVLKPLGADAACSNPARLGRSPGVRRGKKWQRILWLSPTGRLVDAP